MLAPVDDPSAFGVVPTDDGGRVLGFIEKPPTGTAPTNLINAGIYLFEQGILDRIPPGEVWSAERQLFPGLVEEGAALYASAIDAYWLDVGTPDKYLQANLDALAGRFNDPEVVGAREVLQLAVALLKPRGRRAHILGLSRRRVRGRFQGDGGAFGCPSPGEDR